VLFLPRRSFFVVYCSPTPFFPRNQFTPLAILIVPRSYMDLVHRHILLFLTASLRPFLFSVNMNIAQFLCFSRRSGFNLGFCPPSKTLLLLLRGSALSPFPCVLSSPLNRIPPNWVSKEPASAPSQGLPPSLLPGSFSFGALFLSKRDQYFNCSTRHFYLSSPPSEPPFPFHFLVVLVERRGRSFRVSKYSF